MREREKVFFVAPINPFTPRQAEILELMVNGYSKSEIIQMLGITAPTLKNHIYGTLSGRHKTGPSSNPAKLGIFGVVEKAYYGERPQSPSDLLRMIFEDVVFVKKDGPSSSL